MKLLLAIVAMSWIGITPLMAEYRAYRYLVRTKENVTQGQGAYLVTSFLDRQSYLAYNGGENALEANLLDSWMCKGHTGNMRPICPSPLRGITFRNNRS